MLPTFHSDSVHGNEHKFQCALRQQEKDLSNTFNDGIIISNQSLVITNVKRSQMGQYTCIASNSEGEGESNQALLEIQCKQKQQSYGNTANAFRLITLEILCFFLSPCLVFFLNKQLRHFAALDKFKHTM